MIISRRTLKAELLTLTIIPMIISRRTLKAELLTRQLTWTQN